VPVKPVVAQPCARVFLCVRGALSFPLSCSLLCALLFFRSVCLLACCALPLSASPPSFAPSCALSFVRSLAFLSCLGSCLNLALLCSSASLVYRFSVGLCCAARFADIFVVVVARSIAAPLSPFRSRLRALSVSLAAAVLLWCAVDQSVATCVYVLPSRTTACPRCLGALPPPPPPHPASCLLLPSASSCVTFACSHRRYVPKSLPPVHHTPVRA